jgi:RNA polymerase sigma factor (sigma-70 family)
VTAREDVWRAEAPHVLAALLRRSGDFDACEEAVQDALVAAARQWPVEGVPERPRGWLIRVASRRLIDQVRTDQARRRREESIAGPDVMRDVTGDDGRDASRDDTLDMLLLCAHPALSAASQVALTLRAVAGLSTSRIASAFGVPTATMAQRISRAKVTIDRGGAAFPTPNADDLVARIHVVRHVLYLAFNEGYTTSMGDVLVDVDLAVEAIRLTRCLHDSLPSDTETTGLLALMLLTHARVRARVDDAGDLVRLADQDRSLWDHRLIDEGVALVERALPVGPVGPFQLQAAIAAVHAEARSGDATDWPQIAELYGMLDRIAASPVVTLNRAVAIGMADGAQAGLAALQPLLDDPAERRNHRLQSAWGHLLELHGDHAAAADAFRRAARLTNSSPEQRYLHRAAARAAARAGAAAT